MWVILNSVAFFAQGLNKRLMSLNACEQWNEDTMSTWDPDKEVQLEILELIRTQMDGRKLRKEIWRKKNWRKLGPNLEQIWKKLAPRQDEVPPALTTL